LEIAHALQMNASIVALESTVITHGLPRPENLRLAREMEATVRREGATPATVALLDGKIRIGLTDEELARLAEVQSPLKVSHRDFAAAILKKASGGTTVAGTLFAAHHVGIKVFATGGIGGVHKEIHHEGHQENSFDISTDLKALAETPMIVVCAGAKAILNLPATLEYLETMGVPVVGYQTDEFPAFYSRQSGLKTSVRLDSPQEVVDFANAHWSLGMKSAVLVANPVPEIEAIPRSEIEPVIAQAVKDAQSQKIHGQALTPFLLNRINELTRGRSMKANLALLVNNARVAAQVSKRLSANHKRREM